MLTPFWIDEGARVIAVGAGLHGLVPELARRGAQVTVLEADSAAARVAAQRWVDLDRVAVVRSTISSLRAGGSDRSFDIVILVPADEARGGSAATTEEEIASAAGLLRPSGTLIVMFPNPWALCRMLEGRGPGAGTGALGVRALLGAHGFLDQRWLIPYPDPWQPEVVVDARLLESEDGALIAAALVRSPIRSTPGASHLVDPLAAFQAAARAGLASSVAAWFVVAAKRDGMSDVSILRPGSLFLPPEPGRTVAWADPRELQRIGGRWLLHPTESYQPLASGPFAFEPVTKAVPVGVSGEDRVVEALSAGVDAPGARETLAAWWAAARASVDSSEADRRQIAILPRDFIVTAEGDWSLIGGDLTLRFPMPVEVLGLRALGWTLSRAFLGRHWIPGLAPTTSIAAAARRLLDAVGVQCEDEHVHMWQELEVDLAVRTGAASGDRSESRRWIRDVTDATLGSRLAEMPLATLLGAGLQAPAFAAEVSALQARLAAVAPAGEGVPAVPEAGAYGSAAATDLVPVGPGAAPNGDERDAARHEPREASRGPA